jgi:5-methylcytosine-specific restriction enzyme B
MSWAELEMRARVSITIATASDDQATSQYPNAYRGLKVKVSFGFGNFARVPWIAFLGPRQETSKGVYPVDLFYRDQGVLILAHGISGMHSPAVQWELPSDTLTVSAYLSNHFQVTPERYGESFVFAAYEVPLNGDVVRLSTDLDTLISKYQQLFTNAPNGQAEGQLQPSGASAEEPGEPQHIPNPPYTLEEAVDGLFVDPPRFKSMQDLWLRKKNTIVHGPPGVGKSFLCRRLAYALMRERAPDRIGVVQFHQTYSYEDSFRLST